MNCQNLRTRSDASTTRGSWSNDFQSEVYGNSSFFMLLVRKPVQVVFMILMLRKPLLLMKCNGIWVVRFQDLYWSDRYSYQRPVPFDKLSDDRKAKEGRHSKRVTAARELQSACFEQMENIHYNARWIPNRFWEYCAFWFIQITLKTAMERLQSFCKSVVIVFA
jgi:hypothetical protein